MAIASTTHKFESINLARSLMNYLKVAFRGFLRHKGTSAINVTGLALGIACTTLIALFVLDELSYDNYHANGDRVYRLVVEKGEGGESDGRMWVAASPGYGPSLVRTFPEIESTCRFWMWTSPRLSFEGKSVLEDGFAFAEPSVFRIFTFPFIRGDAQRALIAPNTAVVTMSAARKYFGDSNPLGKTLEYRSGLIQRSLTVTGVIEDVPRNSHLLFNVLASFSTWEQMIGTGGMDFLGGDYNYPTYVLLRPGIDPSRLSRQFPSFLDHAMARIHDHQPHELFRLHLQPLRDIYLRSYGDNSYGASGSITVVTIVAGVAILILLLACINYINLTTAQAARRMREIGMRKVLGAQRLQLMMQFLTESVLIAAFGSMISAVLVEAFLPTFNAFTGKNLSLTFFSGSSLLLVVITLVVGCAGGIYPALVLSGMLPTSALKGARGGDSGRATLRSSLVVFQFAVSITLIIALEVVSRQLDFVQHAEMGFNKEQIVSIAMPENMRSRMQVVKSLLSVNQGIAGVTASSRVPSGYLNDALDAAVFHDGQSLPLEFRLPFVRVDYDFFTTFGLTMAAGRSFSPAFGSDTTGAFVINETAAANLGWRTAGDAVGQMLSYGNRPGRIVGVVRDFHFESLHDEIKPMIFLLAGDQRMLSVKIQSGHLEKTMQFLEATWKSFSPEDPFKYYFVDQKMNERYASSERLERVFSAFSLLAIVIASLGLYALAAHATERRTKEIGVRKVLGASVLNIVSLVTREFVLLVALANVVAWPLAYLFMKKWLEDFAYRTDISVWTFVLASGGTILIAVLTVSFRAIAAALANPVEALRYE